MIADPRLMDRRTPHLWRLKRRGIDGLSTRELQIAIMLASGESLSEVGRDFGVSKKTVWTTKSRMMHKLDVSSVAMLTQLMLARGMIQNYYAGEPNG